MFITAAEALNSDGIVLDIRTQEEHGNMRLAQEHTHIPLEQIDLQDFLSKQTKQLFILCHSGGRAAKFAELCHQNGLFDTRVIEGGIVACNDSADISIEGPRSLSDPVIHGHAQQSFQTFMQKNS